MLVFTFPYLYTTFFIKEEKYRDAVYYYEINNHFFKVNFERNIKSILRGSGCEMDIRIRNNLFFLICLTLIINNIPKIIQMNVLGGSVLGGKLVFYPMVIGILYTLYLQVRGKSLLVCQTLFGRYMLAYMAVVFLSFFVGLYQYPYYDRILQGPVSQIEKLPIVLSWLQQAGISISEDNLLILWMFARMLKSLFLEIIYTFGCSYLIFCWYYRDWETAFLWLLRAVIVSVIMLLLYCCIEVPHLARYSWATELLVGINPFLHAIKDNNTWWPPLLWPQQQLRSIFAEPSYFGIYAAFAMPFLWYSVLTSTVKKRLIQYSSLVFLFSFCLFLTKARTAVALFCGELGLLVIFFLYVRYKPMAMRLLIILLCSGISFIGVNQFISMTNVKKDSGVQVYVKENLGSLASENQRSNQARYTINKTNFYIGLEHPILGVGTSLRHAYVKDYLPEDGKNNKEIQMWLKNQKEQGILKFGIPSLGEYLTRFAENGLVGLMAFLFPALLLIRKLLLRIRDKKQSYCIVSLYGCYLISFLGMMASGLGDTLHVTYCYWLLLGLGYAMCFSDQDGVDHS